MSRYDPLHASLRRDVLKRIAALSTIGMVPTLGGLSLATASGSSSYRALVCVFLYGGNDGNNLIIPTDTAGFNTYTTSRQAQSSGGLALPGVGQSGGVLALDNVPYAIHPAMPELQQLWNQGGLAVLFNVGSLVQPVTAAQVRSLAPSSARLPQQLYSHADQQGQAQATSLGGYPTSGWGGRFADQLGVQVGGSLTPLISVAGNAIFMAGNQVPLLALPRTGGLNYPGYNNSSAANQAALAALQTLNAAGSDAILVSTLGTSVQDAISVADLVTPLLSASNGLTSSFPTYSTSSLSQQLARVAQMIQLGSQLGTPTRQIFFVSSSGFDTHNNQIYIQQKLLADLSSSLGGFQTALGTLGVLDNVTTFTMSDFARTLKPASGGGSDHAWGSHHLILGGAVQGSKSTLQSGQSYAGLFGTFPDQTLGGPSDVSSEGRWAPTSSIDQYAATLGNWLGLSSTQLQAALPNLANFPVANLGFLG